jgi:hypothetical protein
VSIVKEKETAVSDIKLAQVIIDARDQNGWHVIGAVSDRHSDGKRPSGVVSFTQPHRAQAQREGRWPEGMGICGTARFYVDEDLNTVFYSGMYDLSRDQAQADLLDRALAPAYSRS